MKNLLLILTLLAFTSTTLLDEEKRTATVKEYDGIAIFSDCKPVNEYTTIGEVTYNLPFVSYEYEDVRDQLIKRTKKTYPTADGIILHLPKSGINSAKVIMFK